MNERNGFLTAAEVAKRFGVTVRTLGNWRSRGWMPEPDPIEDPHVRRKLGVRIAWLRSTIDAWQETLK